MPLLGHHCSRCVSAPPGGAPYRWRPAAGLRPGVMLFLRRQGTGQTAIERGTACGKCTSCEGVYSLDSVLWAVGDPVPRETLYRWVSISCPPRPRQLWLVGSPTSPVPHRASLMGSSPTLRRWASDVRVTCQQQQCVVHFDMFALPEVRRALGCTRLHWKPHTAGPRLRLALPAA